ncbi:hypothetical protein [Foetidibacter luteolus]|uniref:hypothetical protein n=1 Tax=Foetidibacter luteolus TaxID=2608880 RepID=UPI00129A89DD|nr:hypothetical protein [Foetidibacter luteolus]
MFTLLFLIKGYGLYKNPVTLPKFHCAKELDSLTNRWVYTTADTAPKNIGGPEAFAKLLRNMAAETDSADLHITSVEIAFIVDTAGNIYGGRIVDDKTKNQKTSLALLKAMSLIKWQPAICNGKKVAMLHRKKIRIEIEEF